MTPPEPRHRGRARDGTVLAVLAYALVPGERRRRAAGHFRRAGFEALKGLGALVRPGGSPEETGTARRERIEID